MKVILVTIIPNSICKKNYEKGCSWPILLLFFSFFSLEFRYILISSKTQQASFVYQHWRTLWEVTKTNQLLLHNLLEIHIYILKVHLEICIEITYSATVKYSEIFWCIKNWPKWKILYFPRKWHPGNPFVTIWKFSKPNSISSVMMPSLHKNIWVLLSPK